MKTIWIIDHYSSEPQYGGISRQYDFACELSKRGYNAVVISSAFRILPTHLYQMRMYTSRRLMIEYTMYI